MPSSISSFEMAESYVATRESVIERRHVVLLLAAIAITCALVEWATNVWSHSINKYGRQVETEYAEAVGLRSGADGEHKSVLIVGNSTLRCGVDVGDLRNQTQPDLDAHILSLNSHHDGRLVFRPKRTLS